MADTYMFRVFVDEAGENGDRASVVVDQKGTIPSEERMVLTEHLDTVETAFIDDVDSCRVSFVHKDGELDFAGVSALAAASLLEELRGTLITTLHTRGGTVTVSRNAEIIWVRADLATLPPWRIKQLNSKGEVEGIRLEDTHDWEHTMVWAWVDEPKGMVRARTFAEDWGIAEAEGNGSGSMVLAALLKVEIKIKHGKGSVIFARPVSDNSAELGGFVVKG